MANMKLGAGYIVFDGIELLEASARSIRNQVDYIVVVYCLKSWRGNQTKVNTLQILLDLKAKGLIDHFIEYRANGLSHNHQQNAQRNVGLEDALKNNCTHFMTIDTDECYFDYELKYAKEEIVKYDYDATACLMQTYYKTAEFKLVNPDTYYVPLIYKLGSERFGNKGEWNVIADPSRKLLCKNFKAFTREEIQMHHYSYVRKSIEDKFLNHAAKDSIVKQIEPILECYKKWKEGDVALFAGPELREEQLIKVENYFKIYI